MGRSISARELQRWDRERANAAGVAEAQEATEELSGRLDRLRSLLPQGLRNPVRLDFEAMKESPPLFATYDAGGGPQSAMPGRLDSDPVEEDFEPPYPSWIERLIPGWRTRHEQQCERAHGVYLGAKQAWEQHKQRLQDVEEQHRRVEEIRADYQSGKAPAVREALSWTLAQRSHPEGFPHAFSMVYRRAARQLIVEYEFPDVDSAVPALRAVEYQKTKRAFKDVALGIRDRRTLYRHVLASLTLLTLHDLFTADAGQLLERVAFIGVVDTVDKATGRPARPVLISVEVFREAFNELHLLRVDPVAALQGLRANVSSAPTELKPVDPVIEIDLTDPRRVEEEELLSTLSTNENLLDLNPYQFETLIRDLFGKMGYDTYQTRARRDGGVDCVAWYREPAGKRKTVIQAKRYSNVVPVSDVRDLLGAVLKERAGTGILVTTSAFTRGAHEFARGEQLTLWEGSQLLALLHEHVGKQFTIKFPPKDS